MQELHPGGSCCVSSSLLEKDKQEEQAEDSTPTVELLCMAGPASTTRQLHCGQATGSNTPLQSL